MCLLLPLHPASPEGRAPQCVLPGSPVQALRPPRASLKALFPGAAVSAQHLLPESLLSWF